MKKYSVQLLPAMVIAALLAGCDAAPTADNKASDTAKSSGAIEPADGAAPGQAQSTAAGADADQKDQQSTTAPADVTPAETAKADSVTTGDWPMWGGAPGRNMVNDTTGVNLNFVGDDFSMKMLTLLSEAAEVSFEDAVQKLESSALATEKGGKYLAAAGLINFTVDVSKVEKDGKQVTEKDYSSLSITDKGRDALRRVLWTATLGSQTYGNPVVAEGHVLVGTNNGGEYREKHQGDRGVILCFDEKDGRFLWQLTREKLEAGRVNDWPEQGICSTPCVENGRVYVVSNRCEVLCLDLQGFHDGENDGAVTDEADSEELDADVIWSLDMMDKLGVFPHNLATSSPVIHGDLLLLVTSNGVDEAHLEVPSPRAPCFLALNKNTGEVVWEDSTPGIDSRAPEPFNNILHGQWSSPAVGDVNGTSLVFMPGGDGVLYAFNIESGEMVWWFDLNPKTSGWELGGRGTRNAIISTPVFFDNSVVLAVGQDPEHGEGVGHIYRIDATKQGDVSPMIADGDGGWKENPDSAQIWHLGGIDEDGSVTGEQNGLIFRRTISTAGISDGLVYAPDLSGFLHCIDFATGEQKWVYDAFAAVWGSPMVIDGRVLMGDEDGDMVILKAGSELQQIETKKFNSSIYSTPTIANGRMFVSDRSRLYCIDVK
ncbi:MAG: PQQ-binding-like beta-propeller repeat protein [Planctomycetaceae bacterium]